MRRVAVTASVLAISGLPTATAAHAAATAPVTTCATLGKGSTGAAVKTIQKALGIAADGDFGPQTAAAVKTWRVAHQLTRKGGVNAAMWAALPTAVSQKACGQKVSGAGVRLTCASLSRGDHGVAVAVLQKKLGITVTSRFGAGTTSALKAAQKAAKLPVTATTPQATWQTLKLVGTPACEPTESADAIAQTKIRKHVVALASELEDQPGTTTNQVALQEIAWGEKQIGKPYIYGGTGPKGFDCSGLTEKSLLHAGITIPRTAAAQYAGAGPRVSLADAQAGDLLFYASDVTKPSTVYHVVMYVGHGKVLSAPYTGTDVQIQPLFTTDLLPLRRSSGREPHVAAEERLDRVERHPAADRTSTGTAPTLATDGGYGPATKAAVKAWQTKKKLRASGVVKMPTWLTLG